MSKNANTQNTDIKSQDTYISYTMYSSIVMNWIIIIIIIIQIY